MSGPWFPRGWSCFSLILWAHGCYKNASNDELAEKLFIFFFYKAAHSLERLSSVLLFFS